MKYLNSPLKRFFDEKIYTTLPYGDTTYVDIYKRLGWNLAFHNGTDFCPSVDPKRAYGVPVLASQDGVIDKVVWDSPMSTKGNGITISGLPFQDLDGKQRVISTVYWHLSQISVKAGDKVKAGDMIGRLGNSGFVIGNSALPQKGTHIHLGVYQYILENGIWKVEFPDNGVAGAVNPSDWLEDNWQEKAPIMGWLDYLAYFADIKRLVEEFLKGR